MLGLFVGYQIEQSRREGKALLHDIGSNTSDVERVSDVKKMTNGAEIHLPSSVWGLMSLLLLLEGCVLVQDWFETNWHTNDPSLPAQTVEVRLHRNVHNYAYNVTLMPSIVVFIRL